jgi:hypothetical protein
VNPQVRRQDAQPGSLAPISTRRGSDKTRIARLSGLIKPFDAGDEMETF